MLGGSFQICSVYSTVNNLWVPMALCKSTNYRLVTRFIVAKYNSAAAMDVPFPWGCWNQGEIHGRKYPHHWECAKPACSSNCIPSPPNHTLTYNCHSIFWIATGWNPAYDPRTLIIMAGDIETNPALQSTSSARDGTTPMQCHSPGCIRKCHRQQGCCGISRWKKENVG